MREVFRELPKLDWERYGRGYGTPETTVGSARKIVKDGTCTVRDLRGIRAGMKKNLSWL